jgi:diamine N-acetyltransferase
MTRQQSEIYLRKPHLGDVDFLLRLENDPEIWEVSNTSEPFSRDEIEAFIKENVHDLLVELQQRFIIVLRRSQWAVGTVDLFNYSPEDDTAGVGISILPEYRRRGYAKAALKQLIDYAFRKLHLKKLYCSIFTDNLPSIRLFSACGFKPVSQLPERFELSKEKEELFFELEN